jgi:putative transcription antitermination factor YqgF
MDSMKNYLGLDWGKAKIGVALAHEETRLALAYGVLKNDDTLLENIGALLEKEEIGTVVIGIHKSDAYHGEHEGEKLGKLIEKRFKVVVEYQDEMFTSKMAQQNLISKGYSQVSAHDDAEAASILLQSFLEKKS